MCLNTLTSSLKKRGKSIHFFRFFLCLFKDTYTDRVGYWDYCLRCFRNQFKYSQTQQDLRTNTPAVEATGCWKNKRQAGRSEINSYPRKFQEFSIFLLLPPFFLYFPFGLEWADTLDTLCLCSRAGSLCPLLMVPTVYFHREEQSPRNRCAKSRQAMSSSGW